MIKLTISNEITIENPPVIVLDYCKRNLVVDNPEYAKKERLGLWLGNTPRTLSLYKMSGNKIITPIGTFRDIYHMIAGKYPLEINQDLASNKSVNYGVTVNDVGLYDYQMDAVNALLDSGYGILESKAGSGKTQMGIALVVALGVKCLWLTHTQDLLKQSYDRAAQYIDKSLLGKITAGKVEIGSGITFATVQTLSKQDMNQYKYEWDCVIVDECHRVAGTPTSMTMFSKVINSLAAVNKYGLSATVHRSDGLIKTTYALLGGIAYTVPDEAIADKVMQVEVRKCNTFAKLSDDALDTDGTIVYAKLITSLCNDVMRNNFIASNIASCSNHYNLILSDRLEHLQTLYNMLPDKYKSQSAIINGKMTSKKGKAEREQAIKDMQYGKKRFLFASYKLAKEGLDIPRLDRLHLVTPQKDYSVIVQSVGRIARTCPDKENPICYDYVDDIGMMQGFYKKRVTSYKKCDCIGEWSK